MAAEAHVTTAPGEREIVVRRHLNVPPEQVYRVWTDSTRLDTWWGPRGFQTCTDAIELRPGGFWSFTMLGPDGTVYPNHILYLEIEPSLRLHYRHGCAANDPEAFDVNVNFVRDGEGTRLSLHVVFPSAAACQAARDSGAEAGGQSTMDRFEEQVAALLDSRD